MSVEAKAGEGFDRTLEAWLADASPTSGKPARLAQLKSILRIETNCPGTLRYQLLHRTASAIREAERFAAPAAMLLVQSFSSDPESADAYATFCQVMGCTERGRAVLEGPRIAGTQLFFAWVDCAPSALEQLAASL